MFGDQITPPEYSTDIQPGVISPLEYLSCYSVSGDDATDFLQGQFTNDVKAVTPSLGQLTSYCTPKGRMLAIFYLCHWQDKYLIFIPKDIATSVMQRLQMYIMRSKVSITEENDLALVGISGNTSDNLLSALQFDTPTDAYQTSQNDHGVCMQIPGEPARYCLCLNETATGMITNAVDSETKIFADSYWQWLDILNGLPMVYSDTQEAFVPQMTNMELIDGVSFSKGCYPGQEVVARLHYLGNANRRMYRFTVTTDSPIKSGDELFSSEKTIGNVVSVVAENDSTYSGLAVLRVENITYDINTQASNGSTLELLPLPYTIPDNKEKNKPPKEV